MAEPKTAKSRRVLAPSAGVMRVLRDHRTRQLTERVAAANTWAEAGFVFTSETGRPMDGRNVLRALRVGVRDPENVEGPPPDFPKVSPDLPVRWWAILGLNQ